jgi:hypothetical protein
MLKMEIVGQLFSAGKDRHKKNVPEALERFGKKLGRFGKILGKIYPS